MKKIYCCLLITFMISNFSIKAQQLSGSYTINASQVTGGTNFQSITAAVDTLKKYGVSAPVIFNIASGTYTEQIVIPAIAGASTSNTITFQSAMNHADSVTLNYAAGNNVPIVTLNGASYITFKYITITSTLATGMAFQLNTTASYDSIVNCKINAVTYGIYANPLSGGKNVFSYNVITGNARGIDLRGTATVLSDSNVVTGNIIEANNHGLYLHYGSNTFVANNSIISNTEGIQNNYGSGQQFYHNTVTATTTGIRITYNTAADSANEWKNNIITSSSGTGNVIRATNNGTNNKWDYNIYHTYGANIFWNSAAAWNQWLGNGQDIHSVIANPYISATDLRLKDACSNKYGYPLASVTTDIEGNTRGNPPTAGAYEYTGIDNITIDALVQPAFPMVAGVQDVIIRVKNVGSNTVSSFNISLVLNNGNPITQYWSGNLNPCDTASIPFSGINLLNENDVTIYTSAPNNNNDTYLGNDTLKTVLYVPLSGIYTIGHNTGANFASFNEAIETLIIAGVSDAVVFDIQSDTFTEQITIPAITGVSATNTITFKSAANNADSVILKYAAGTNIPIVKFDNATYINFKYLTVVSTTTSTGRAFELTGLAYYDSISYCKINAVNTGIYAGNFLGGKNVFSHNQISAFLYGIQLEGGTLPTDSNIISHNTIELTTTNLYNGNAIYMYNNSNTKIRNNTIRFLEQSLATNSNAIFGISNLSGIEIAANVITHASMGINMTFNQGNQTSPTLIANNSIITNLAGINNSQSPYTYIYHNTIKVVSNEMTTSFGIGGSLNDNSEVKNNVITIISPDDRALPFGVSQFGANNTIDYNVYYNFSGTVSFAGYNNLTSLQVGTGHDSHSVVLNPAFVSEMDLHMTSGCKFGIPIAAITTDIEGNTRNNPPIAGAYEYATVNDIAIDTLVSPVFPIMEGVQDLVVRVKNVGTNTITSFNVSYILNNGSPVSQSWNTTLAPCDTISVTFSNVNLLSGTSITVYTDYPNTNSDSYKINDTLRTQLLTPLNGVYTIGRTINDSFASFNEAVEALIVGGVSGPVVFDVQSDTFTEQITIPAIQGTSATNTITFQSKVNHADSVIINYATEANFPIVTLNGANYINFKHITVASTTTTGRAFWLKGTASYNSIVNCKISAKNAGIYANALLGGKNVFVRNIISGSNTGIYLRGTSEAIFTDSNVIASNKIETGITATTAYGLDLYYGSNTFVVNNIIISNAYGIRNYYGSGQRFYHNTISAVTNGIFVNYPNNAYDTANEWRNNIIISSNTGNAVRITNPSIISPSINNIWDYNLYYANGAANLFYNSATQFALWQASGQDKHSVVYRPAFTSATDFMPNPSDTASWAINGRGIHLDTTYSAYIGTDINGNPRPLKREDGVPDIGAYEFTPTVKSPLAIAVGSLAADSTQSFLSSFNNQDTIAKIKWYSGIGFNLPAKVEVRQYTGVQPLGTSETDRFMYFYTDIKDSGAGNYYYDLAVSYQDAWLGKIEAEQDLRLQKRTDINPWAFYQSALASLVDTATNVITDQYLPSFGSFTGAELSNPLPVQLLSFKANAVKNDVLLTWSTASEVNASNFVIERLVSSPAQREWSVIGKVKAKGNTNTVSHYDFTDNGQLSTNNQLYYRLRIVDNDRSYEYSKVVSVSREQQATQSLTVYPNPFSASVNVEFVSENEGVAHINIIDVMGRDVQLNISQHIIKGNNILTIDTDKLNNGIYFLSVQLNGEKQILKLIKQ